MTQPGLAFEPFPWPTGFRAAAVMSFDFDAEASYVSAGLGVEPSGVVAEAAYGPRVGVPLLADVFRRHDVSATFFVPGVDAERHPEVLRSLLAGGHELGVHGYRHVPPSQLSRTEEEDELDRTIAILTDLGADVRGYRSPAWDVSSHTDEILGRRSIAYSSHLMTDIRPFRHPSGVIELPVQWILDDVPQFAWSVAGWTRIIRTCAEVESLWLEEFEAIRQLGGLYVLTMHPLIMGRPSRVQLLDRILAQIRSSGDVWIATGREVAEHADRVLPR